MRELNLGVLLEGLSTTTGELLLNHLHKSSSVLLNFWDCHTLDCQWKFRFANESLSNAEMNVSAASFPYLNHLSSLSLPGKIQSWKIKNCVYAALILGPLREEFKKKKTKWHKKWTSCLICPIFCLQQGKRRNKISILSAGVFSLLSAEVFWVKFCLLFDFSSFRWISSSFPTTHLLTIICYSSQIVKS